MPRAVGGARGLYWDENRPSSGTALDAANVRRAFWAVARKAERSVLLNGAVAVELADDPAGLLLVSPPVARPDNWLNLPGGVVTPALVARCITDARGAGWDPRRRGPALRVHLPAQVIGATIQP